MTLMQRKKSVPSSWFAGITAHCVFIAIFKIAASGPPVCQFFGVCCRPAASLTTGPAGIGVSQKQFDQRGFAIAAWAAASRAMGTRKGEQET